MNLKKIKIIRHFARPFVLFIKFWNLILTNYFSKKIITSPNGPIVSLTTYGIRIKTVYLTIESIVRGKEKPSRIILYLDSESDFKSPPKSLGRLIRRGLEVHLTKNYGPHKKYYSYLCEQEKLLIHSLPLVTADDDVIYPDNWLLDLHRAYKQNPNVVNCFLSRTINIAASYELDNYKNWHYTQNDDPSFKNMAIGVSGVIYPQILLIKIFSAGDQFLLNCMYTDDIWLHLQAIKSGFKVRQINTEATHFKCIPFTQENALMNKNIGNNENDRLIQALYHFDDIKIMMDE